MWVAVIVRNSVFMLMCVLLVVRKGINGGIGVEVSYVAFDVSFVFVYVGSCAVVGCR